MTKKEAIEILKNITIEDWEYGDYEALEMAIEALEQYCCADCKHRKIGRCKCNKIAYEKARNEIQKSKKKNSRKNHMAEN